ncbi:MAG: SDR family NAD(P)-dependent oxidoreductase [Bacteroidales bacterium]|nr:SDR family NAD(P)-dependent oxidoreductase [Bacteroidales bacterium]
MEDFKNKKVLITGGSRGIGKAVAKIFADLGAIVAVSFNVNEKAAKQTLGELSGNNHIMVKADISKPEECEKMVNEVIEKFGKIDILVNNAALYSKHCIDEVNFNDWQNSWNETIDLNLTGVANVCFLVAQHMIKRKYGKIINISSRGAFRGEPDYPAYGASKAGVNSLSQSLALKLAKYNIFVGVIAPGFVDTDMTTEFLHGKDKEKILSQSPLNRAAKPEEIAYVVSMLASDKAGYMTGCIVDVNGASYLRT